MTENRAFLIIHAIMLAFVLVGFGQRFYLAPLFGDPAGLDAPLIIHGWFLTAWFTLVVVQAWLAFSGRRGPHRSLLWLAWPVAAGVVVTSLWINTRLALLVSSPASGLNIFIWGNYFTLVAFVGLLAFAIRKRREPDAHRRLLAFASIALIGPAFARFAFWELFGALGADGGPPFAAAGMLLMMAIVAGYDLLGRRKILAATFVGAAAVIVFSVIGVAAGVSGAGFTLIQQLHAGASGPAAQAAAQPRAMLAEAVRFELTEDLRLRRFSRPLP